MKKFRVRCAVGCLSKRPLLIQKSFVHRSAHGNLRNAGMGIEQSEINIGKSVGTGVDI
jgi:hypothetical protein